MSMYTYIYIIIYNYTSNGRFAVDREFEYIELVSENVLGSSLDNPGSSRDPLVQVREFDELLWKCIFQLLAKFGRANQKKIVLQKQKMRFQLLGKFGRGNQIYMNVDDQFPTQKCQNHCFYNSKWCSWNSNPEYPEFPEMESSTAAPSLHSTCAGGHDDGS